MLSSDTVDSATNSQRRLDLIVVLGLALYLGTVCYDAYAPYSFIFRDGSFYAQINRSIADSLTLRQETVQPGSWYDGSLPWYREMSDGWSNISVGGDGEWYPKHSYLMPIFSTPFYVLFGPYGLLLFNLLALFLALFSGYRLASRYVGSFPSAVAVMAVATAPVIPYLVYSYSHDVFCAALVAGGCALLGHRRWALGGLLLGLSLFAKITNALIAVPLGLALTMGNGRGLVRAAVAASIPLVCYAIANTVMFGDPFTTSYHRILTIKGGQQSIVSTKDLFDTPLVEGWNRFFSHSHEGELAQVSLLPLLAYLGLPFLLFRAPAVTIALILALTLFLYAFARYHYGGARFFMPWLALSVVPLSAFFWWVNDSAQALVIRRLGWMNRDLKRMALKAFVFVTAILVVVVWVSRGPGNTHRMSASVEKLSVTLDGYRCDYFNMSRQKWECSRLDPSGAYYVGRPLGQQCAFAGRPMMWAPANPAGKPRVVSWLPESEGRRLRVWWGLDARSRMGSVRFRIRTVDGPEIEFETRGQGELSERILDNVLAGPGRPVTVLIDPGNKEGLYLCLDVEIL